MAAFVSIPSFLLLFFFELLLLGGQGLTLFTPFFHIFFHSTRLYLVLCVSFSLSLSPFLSSFHSVSTVEETLSFSTGNLRVVSPLFLVFKQPNISSNNTEKYQIKLRTHFHTPKKEKKKNKKISDLQQLWRYPTMGKVPIKMSKIFSSKTVCIN